MSANNPEVNPSNISRFQIYSAGNGTDSVDVSMGAVEISYYESILSNSVSLTATIVETGLTDRKINSEQSTPSGVIDTLPIRGGEQAIIEFEDNQSTPNKLSFKGSKSLYVNRVRGINPGTHKDTYSIDFCTREFISNEQTRVIRRYDGKISDSVENILKDSRGLKTEKEIDADSTAIKYNFIGNDKKPFYVCTWLASKSIPELSVDGKNSVGGAAGYFFFENYDGFKFKSIDKLLDNKTQPKIKRYIFNDDKNRPDAYDGKIVSVNIERDIDLQQNLTLGTYSNSSIFFDFYAMDYIRRNYNVDDDQKDKIKNAGSKDIDWVADEFRTPTSRLMSHVLDVGALPSGKDITAQLENWKSTPFDPTYDAANTMVQSIMRYNQLFTIKTNIIIPGDFSLRAGDLIYCDFPGLTIDKSKEVNRETGGIYMIASICHRITPRNTFSSLTLVRDTFGRKPFK